MESCAAGERIDLSKQPLAIRSRPGIVAREVFEQRVAAERIDEFLWRNIQRSDQTQRLAPTCKPAHRLEQHVYTLLRTQPPDEQDVLRAGGVRLDTQEPLVDSVV